MMGWGLDCGAVYYGVVRVYLVIAFISVAALSVVIITMIIFRFAVELICCMYLPLRIYSLALFCFKPFIRNCTL